MDDCLDLFYCCVFELDTAFLLDRWSYVLIEVGFLLEIDEEFCRQAFSQSFFRFVLFEQWRIVELGLILLVLLRWLGLFLFGWFSSFFPFGLPDDSFLFLSEQSLKLVDILIIGQLVLFFLVLLVPLALLLQHSIGIEILPLLVVPSSFLIQTEHEVIPWELETDGFAG